MRPEGSLGMNHAAQMGMMRGRVESLVGLLRERALFSDVGDTR